MRRTSVPRRSFFDGRFTGDGMRIGDKDGEFAGFVHKKEYVIPQKVLSESFVALLLPAIEAVRKNNFKGSAEGVMTSASSDFKKGKEFSLRRVENLLADISNRIKKMPKEI